MHAGEIDIRHLFCYGELIFMVGPIFNKSVANLNQHIIFGLSARVAGKYLPK